MSLRINHNIAAINANRNLKLTNSALNKSMQKLSSGFRINQAADDPAGLVISEQFRAQIAGLNRAIQNSEGSISMIQTAEGALTEINNLLISMRELAIHAANEGFNDADQLAADQAEIQNAIKTIDRISTNTQFGTKKILDGSKDNIATITSANNTGLTIRSSNMSDGVHSVTVTQAAESQATLNTTSLGLSLRDTDGNPYNLAGGVHNVDVVQASEVAEKSTGAVTLTDAFGNGLQISDTAGFASIAFVGGAATAAAVNGTTAGTYNVVINYQENGESPAGKQTLQVELTDGETQAQVLSQLNTQVNLNSALAGKVQFSTVDAGGFKLTAVNTGAQYSIQTSASTKVSGAAGDYIAFTQADARGISDNELKFTVNTKANNNATSTLTLASTTWTDFNTMVSDINSALANAARGGFGTIAASVNDIEAFLADNNKIEFRTKDEGSDYSIQVHADAGDTSTGNLRLGLNLSDDTLAVKGTDALIRFNDYTNTISKVAYGTTANVTLYDADDPTSRGSIDMIVAKSLTGINVGNLLLDVDAAKFDVRLDGGPAQSVMAGANTTIYTADRTESLDLKVALTSSGGTETINNTDQSLVFQIGANVGQTAKIGLRDMSASSLGKGIAGNLFRSLSDVNVTTVQGAQDAQSIVDAAILEVSTTRGTLGSFQKNTLESNLRNLRIAAQNLTASESQIRDTDMAEEMSEFTKNQILVQAGTAMLAQANQVPQVVLSLF
jgi:flagellin